MSSRPDVSAGGILLFGSGHCWRPSQGRGGVWTADVGGTVTTSATRHSTRVGRLQGTVGAVDNYTVIV